MSEFKPAIGIEIHCELKTKTKMFCSCLNDPEEKRANFNICPVCTGQPGAIPTPNKEAIRHMVRIGTALGGKIADFSEFDRKNYFYPDLPKGYQISQYKHPIVDGGVLAGIAITRVHLEEDTARSQHGKEGESLIDYNRSGVPLMELVTEPVVASGEEASNFARELQLLLRYLGCSDANMEKGEMRIEANISVSNRPGELGTKVEVKNLNSFKSVEKAVAYEIERQKEAITAGEKIVQETRGWDELKGKTFSQRSKEEAHDYRYFPEPDIPKLRLSLVPDFARPEIQKSIPELPEAKRVRYASEYGIKKSDTELLVGNPDLDALFVGAGAFLGSDKTKIQLAANYILSDVASMEKVEPGITSKIPAEEFGQLVTMANAGEVSSRGAKDLLAILAKEGGSVRDLATKSDLFQKSDEGALRVFAEKVITENPTVIEQYRAGKEASLQFLVGQCMRLSRGSANPQVLAKILKELLK